MTTDEHPDTLDTCAQPGCRNPVTTYEHLPPSDVCSVDHGIRKAERERIVAWHRSRAEHYVHLNKLADWHNECADAIERCHR